MKLTYWSAGSVCVSVVVCYALRAPGAVETKFVAYVADVAVVADVAIVIAQKGKRTKTSCC
jgi:hypothetical protein